MSLKNRNFLKLLDYTPAEIETLLDLAADLKARKKAGIRHMLCSQRFCLRQLPCMAVVKGVVLCNDTGKFHR